MPATIFSGANVKGLKDNYVMGTGSDATSILSGTDDPRTVAQSANKGSLYMRKGSNGGQVFRKLDDGSTTNWTVVGTTGLNYVPNPDGDAGVTDWNTYADAAGTTPVDGTGGAANITLTQTTVTAEILRGTGSFKLAKDAANRQGEGVSIDLDKVENADQNAILGISFEYDATDSDYADGDIGVFIYDIDNAQLITVDPDSGVQPNKGKFQGTFASTGADDYRLILHITSTNAAAYDFFFDDVQISKQELNFGPALTDGIERSSEFTFSAGWGTTSNEFITVRRAGDKAIIQGRFTTGTVAASTASIDLPADLVIDSTKLSSNSTGQKLGVYATQPNSGTAQIFFGGHAGILWYDGSDTNTIYFAKETAAGGYVKNNGDAITTSSEFLSFNAEIPILGWSTNVVNSESRQFKVANFAANGTRVTATPTSLGEFRTLIKDNAASTYSDTDGSSRVTSADGFRIYAIDGSGAGTSTEPNSWHIFVGKNKHVEFEFYSGTGRTGFAYTDFRENSSGDNFGLKTGYDPTSGVASVVMPVTGSTQSRDAGITQTSETAAFTALNDLYFDVNVSDQALVVQTEPLISEIILSSGNGYGSTNTRILRFSTVDKNVGNDMTLTQSATDGDSITINKTGNYHMTAAMAPSAGNNESAIGFTKNASGGDLTTTIYTVSTPTRLIHQFIGSISGVLHTSTASWSGKLEAGDIIRPHGNGVAQTASYTQMSIKRIS